MIYAAFFCLWLSMILVLACAVRGPTIYDRILAANAFGSVTVGCVAVFAYAVQEYNYLDIALVYALINFIGTVGLLRYFRYSRAEGDGV